MVGFKYSLICDTILADLVVSSQRRGLLSNIILPTSPMLIGP